VSGGGTIVGEKKVKTPEGTSSSTTVELFQIRTRRCRGGGKNCFSKEG